MILLKSAENSPTDRYDPTCLYLECWSNTNKAPNFSQTSPTVLEAAIFVKVSSPVIPSDKAMSSYYMGSASFDY